MLKVINPATGDVVKELQTDNSTSVASKFQNAKLAQKQWAKVAPAERIAIIRQFRDRLEKDKQELAQTLTLEVGKPLKQSINELNGAIGRIDFFLEKTVSALKDEVVFTDKSMTETIVHEPLGVIANISAWNYPYLVGSNVFIPALLTGNSVLYKPSEFATLTGLAITERLHQSGVPKDAFQILVGGGVIGSELLKQPINGVFFTGSYSTGKKIAEAVAGRMIKIQLELGGKDPAYVCEDADVISAAESLADGAFYNNGQSCCSVERIYVHSKIYDSFVEHFMKNVNGFKIGEPMSEDTYIAALTREAQIAVLDRQVKDAKAKGAKLMSGGQRLSRPGYYFAPTVFTNVTHEMELMREESFGPIIGIQKVKDDEEALTLMNDTVYGLTAGIYTPNKARAEKLLSAINSGSVYWNCCDRVSPRLPWSGRGHSGLGATLSTYGILAFTQPKAWHLRTP